jgi:hypothetical protein
MRIMQHLSLILMMTGLSSAENISGLWTSNEVNSEAKNISIIYSQHGDKVTVMAYFDWRGMPTVWDGTGTITGNKLAVNYRYSVKPTGWGDVDGRIEGIISDDGKTIVSTAFYGAGQSSKGTHVKLK